MFLAKPDWEKRTSEVLINFEQALEIIRMMDNITQGIKKIVYLVGWQGLGHDDCYPEMEVINPYLKRDCDATPRDSFMWLFEEAKKYNTVVSVHGNIADEYDANQSHPEFVEASAITKYPDGTPAVIEVFYGRNAYKTSYKQYWESGLFKKYLTDSVRLFLSERRARFISITSALRKTSGREQKCTSRMRQETRCSITL